MSKQLEQLYYKALEKGYANKNGRMSGYGYMGPLESQWEIIYKKETHDLFLSHWGTLILHVGRDLNKKLIVKDFYGQSKSDRDAICQVCNLMGLPYWARFRPSTGDFELHADFGTGEVIKKVRNYGNISSY